MVSEEESVPDSDDSVAPWLRGGGGVRPPATMAVNLRHHFFAAQAVIPMMREAAPQALPGRCRAADALARCR